MAKYLLDTNACIALRQGLKGKTSRDAARSEAQQRLIARWKAMPANDIVMSLFTLGELRVGLEKQTSAANRASAETALAQLCARIRVLEQPGDDAASGGKLALAHHYAAIRAELERQGAGIGPNDTWIAAHARTHRLTVVTNNTSEFARVPGLAVEDWTA